MPPTTIAQTNERIDNLHKQVKFLLKLVGSVFAICFLPWIGWVSLSLNSMNGDIRAIKQAEKINGTEIVNRLEKPPSIDQLKLTVGTPAIASFKATGTRLVASHG